MGRVGIEPTTLGLKEALRCCDLTRWAETSPHGSSESRGDDRLASRPLSESVVAPELPVGLSSTVRSRRRRGDSNPDPIIASEAHPLTDDTGDGLSSGVSR